VAAVEDATAALGEGCETISFVFVQTSLNDAVNASVEVSLRPGLVGQNHERHADRLRSDRAFGESTEVCVGPCLPS
jgi:hypothetical protein